MSKYYDSAQNATAITPATASSRVSTGISIPTGKVWYMTGYHLPANATTGPLIITDCSVGATTTTPALTISLATAAAGIVESGRAVQLPAPGVRFATNPCAFMAASGSVPIGELNVFGYFQG